MLRIPLGHVDLQSGQLLLVGRVPSFYPPQPPPEPFEHRLCGTGFRLPTITAALKEFDQFALRAGVDLLVRWFHSRRPPCRTSRQDYRRSRLPTPRRCCPRCQLHAPEQKSTRSARRIAPSSQQFSSPQPEGGFLIPWFPSGCFLLALTS